MEEKFEAWELAEFNLKEQINLKEKLGLIKLYKSESGTIVLAGDADYGVLDQKNPTPASFVNSDSILGFVLDIGIQRQKMLTRGNGFYFGIKLTQPQSMREIFQKDFDEDNFEKIAEFIKKNYQSGEKGKELLAIKMQLLFDTYNNARLLFPTYYAESYLSLMRIIDALSAAEGSYDFATYVAMISPSLNKDVYGKLTALSGYEDRIKIAINLFESCLEQAKKKSWGCYEKMAQFDDSAKVIFSCFYSAYQYRNKFVHMGFPFPDTVKDSLGLEEGSGTAYLHPALGISWSKVYRPGGMKEGDSIDIHELIGDDAAKEFKDIYFKLLPTWHFLKSFVRGALVKEI